MRRAIVSDMIRPKLRAACLSVVVLVGSGASLAAGEPEAPSPPLPPIDWRDFIDTDMNGDHVVGEELCAAPGAAESLPSPFVII
jgi:hypothetical protein